MSPGIVRALGSTNQSGPPGAFTKIEPKIEPNRGFVLNSVVANVSHYSA